MSFIADLHVHSYLSRATSKRCNLEGLHRWAQLKGIRVVGTGDFTHPAWFAELTEKLVPSSRGLFRLNPAAAQPVDKKVPGVCRSNVDFMITGEISSIYKKNGKTRKVHSVLLIPDFVTAERINTKLDRLGNIKSDGRPILGLDPRDLLEITLEANDKAYMIPAHIWTPWFSMLGSKSGFDSVAECFDDLKKYIFAVETGLSSDPPMNWRVKFLDEITLVSNSDLHSPENMGRNANVFNCPIDFSAMRNALEQKDPEQFGGTIDMFPEKGKYHCDGHRKCGICMEPEQSLAADCLCPACGKPLVLGVLHRVTELAARPMNYTPSNALHNEYVIPLPEILAEIYDCGVKTKKVTRAYHRLLDAHGPELAILREIDLETIRDEEPGLLAEAVRRLRNEEVLTTPGFDGEYGLIHVFRDEEKDALQKQGTFFEVLPGSRTPRESAPETTVSTTPRDEIRELSPTDYVPRPDDSEARCSASENGEIQLQLFAGYDTLSGLNARQREAAVVPDGPGMIVAGPGTGKTRTLTHRIVYLVSNGHLVPENILAVTFTNRAVREMKERLKMLLGEQAKAVNVTTFHALCLTILREQNLSDDFPNGFSPVDQEEAARIVSRRTEMPLRKIRETIEQMSRARRNLADVSSSEETGLINETLRQANVVTLDELIPTCVAALRENPDALADLGFKSICVDEYQDLNRAQFELIRLFAPDGNGLYVIGDPDQAIYGFRGSDVSFFLEFTDTFPQVTQFRLTKNYRSSCNIIEAASAVIEPARTKISSVNRGSSGEPGSRIRVHRAYTPASEAEFITHQVEKLIGGTAHFSMDSGRVSGFEKIEEAGFSDIAVLVRLRSLVKPVANALRRLGLPVQVVGDDQSAVRKQIREAAGILRELPPSAAINMTPLESIDCILEGRTAIPDSHIPADRAKSALEVCRRFAENHTGTLREFLDKLSLREEADAYSESVDKIAVMTIHASKGLEFPVVFIAACEDGIIPFIKPGKEETDLDEERRLLYVAMTRAESLLFLTSSKKRTLFGKKMTTALSPFLNGIPEELIERVSMPGSGKKRTETRQLQLNLEISG